MSARTPAVGSRSFSQRTGHGSRRRCSFRCFSSSGGSGRCRPDGQSPFMSIVEAEPRRRGSLALRVVQIGAIAVVLAVTTFHAFELDRFFVPKELVLHAAAVLAALLSMRALWRMSVTRVDLLLAGYLALSALSALMATNRW